MRRIPLGIELWVDGTQVYSADTPLSVSPEMVEVLRGLWFSLGTIQAIHTVTGATDSVIRQALRDAGIAELS